MVLVPSDIQPELPTVVVEGSTEENRGVGAMGQFLSDLQNHGPVASGAKSLASGQAILVQLPSLDGDGEQANMAWLRHSLIGQRV